MAILGLKNIALAIGLLVIGSTGYTQPVPPSVPPTAPKLPTRPAPVSGRVAMDPAAVALHPATATPVVATSTARQVQPPANLNEPLLKPETEQAAGGPQGKPHIDHTEGKKMPEATKGSKKVNKVPGQHVDKAVAGRRKKKGSKGKAEKLAQVDTEQARGVAVKHGEKTAAKAHTPKDKTSKPHLVAHRAIAVASAPTVSTARELKADAHVKHAVKKGAHKTGAHHASMLNPAVKQKKKALSAQTPA